MDPSPSPTADSPDSRCMGQYNVGVLDVVGVTIVWFTVFRWIMLITFVQDINIFCCISNPQRLDNNCFKIAKNIVAYILSYGSLIYVTIQGSHCGERLVIALMVFMGFYECVFTVAKSYLWYLSLGRFCCFSIQDMVMIATSVIAILDGGVLRVIGIFGIVVYVALSFSCFHTEYVDGTSVFVAGPITVKYLFLYPCILASYVTVLVNAQDEWIPRPQNRLEYALLIGRIISGMGILDIVAAFCNAILNVHHTRAGFQRDPCLDLKTQIFWWGLQSPPDLSAVENITTINIRHPKVTATNPVPSTTTAAQVVEPKNEIESTSPPTLE